MRKNSFNNKEHDAGLVDKYINTAYDKVVIVSDNIEDVKKAAALFSNPEDFAKLMEHVDDLVLLVNIQEELITVAAASDQVVLVGNSIDNVITVSTNLDVINVVGDNILALQNIDANMVSITTVDAHIAEITAVFNDLANIDTVALNIDHVNTVAANIDAIVTAATEVIAKHAEVMATAAQVALDKESVDASQIAVAADAAAVEQHATDVELWAGQVEESKGVVTTLEELARRWAVGILGSGVDEPTDQNNAYWYATKAEESATEARNNANQTFKSGGYFQPTLEAEYPNVVGVVVDTIWLVKFTNDTDSYVMTTGDLTGVTIKNGYMLVYDTPSNTFDYIPTTLSGASSVNHQSPDAKGNIQLSAEDFTDIYSKTESDAITDVLALTIQQQGTAITELESSMTEAQNSIGSLETGLQTTNTTVTELTTEVDKKANSTEVVKLSGVGGGVDVPKWANDAARPDTTDLTKAILGYNTERGEYEAFNPELNEWGAVGGGSGELPYEEVVIVSGGEHGAGLYTLPTGYEWSDFEYIEYTMGQIKGNTHAIFGSLKVDKDVISKAGWNSYLNGRNPSESVITEVGIVYATDSSFNCYLTNAGTGVYYFYSMKGYTKYKPVLNRGITAKSGTTASWGTLSGGTVYPIAMVGYTKRYASTNNSAVIQLTPDNTTGGTFTADGKVQANQRYELDIASVLGADWVGAKGIEVIAEIYNDTGYGVEDWGESGTAFETGGYFAKASVINGKIAVQSGSLGLTSSSSHTGNPFGNNNVIAQAPCRIRVSKGDQVAARLVGNGGAGKTVLYDGPRLGDGEVVVLGADMSQFDMIQIYSAFSGGGINHVLQPIMVEPQVLLDATYGELMVSGRSDGTVAQVHIAVVPPSNTNTTLHVKSFIEGGVGWTGGGIYKVIGINYA